MERLAHKEDCEILRDNEHYNRDDVVVIDCDGDIVFRCPKNWADGDVWKCLELMNSSHDIGYRSGQRMKQHEIKNVLGI